MTGGAVHEQSAADHFAGARRICENLTASRLAFSQFFDALLADKRSWRKGPSAPRSFLHALYLAEQRLQSDADFAELDPAQAADAAAMALVALAVPERMAHAASTAAACGLFDPAVGNAGEDPAEARAEIARQIASEFGERAALAELHKGTLEYMTSPEAAFVDPDLFAPAIMLARKRLCRIETVDGEGQRVTGTGFLIGPSAVLTNWHVVADVPDPRGSTPLKAVFDFGQQDGLPSGADSIVPARNEWRLAWSDVGELAPQAHALNGWWMDAATRKAWRDMLADHLDFAVVMLEGAPGMMRGWYDLEDSSSALLNATCAVFHHPGVTGRTITFGEFCLQDGGGAPSARAFHTATTIRGSSGGLVIDAKGRPAALHHLGLRDSAFEDNSNPPPSTPEEVVNVAIPLSAIAGKLAGQLKQIGEFDGLALNKGCLGNGRPVFGRRQLLEKLAELRTGCTKRVLCVRPPINGSVRRPGKTFTTEILEALFPPPNNLFVKLTADEVRPGAKAMAKLILDKISAAAADELPDSQTTQSAYEQVLVASMREIIADRWPKSLVWLVLDDLDVHDLTDAGGRAFLNQLYSRVAEIPQLRIVLIGLQFRLDSIPEDLVIESDIRQEDLSDVAGLFEKWIIERGAVGPPIDKNVLKMFAAAMASYAGDEAPLEILGEFTSEHWAGPLGRFFDQ